MKRILSLLLIVIYSTCTWAQSVDYEALDAYYEKMVTDWELPSATIGIVKDGEVVFKGSYGVMEVGKEAKPDENTLYAIASNSKAFTATMIGMLVQEGKLSWDDKVKSHLPYFALYDPWVSANTTIRDILSHRVGLGTFSGDVIWYKSDLTAREIVERIQYVPKAFDFRSGYGYSNLMYITAGLIIEEVSGKSYGVNLQERILDPLGMDRTTISLDDLDKLGNYATPHANQEGKNIPIVWESWEKIAALGGIVSSVEDVSKWMIFNMNNGIVGKDTLLTKETRNMVWMPHNNFMVDQTSVNELNINFSAYALGWSVGDYRGEFRVSHTGGYDGMITAVTMLPDQKLGVVVLTNGMNSPIRAASYYALDQFVSEGQKDWSEFYLTRTKNYQSNDTRISDRKEGRVAKTKPALSKSKIAGVYQSDIYGKITVKEEGKKLRLIFEHSEALSATLEHWHYDVWQIKWDVPHAWFDFGTVQFNTDNNLKVTGMTFDVPNDDIFFEELKPYRIED